MPNTRENLIELLGKAHNATTDACFEKDLTYAEAREIEADVLIANGVTIQKWIPVTERLPEEKQLVLAVCKSGKIFVGDYWNCYGTIIWRIRTARDSTKNITQIVTHWMPLPTAPKGE